MLAAGQPHQFSLEEGGIYLYSFLSQDGGAQLFRLCLHQQWLCGSVTCPRSGRLGQPQSKVVDDGGKRGEFLSKVELWVKEERERRRRRGEFAPEGLIFFKKFGRRLIVRMPVMLLL